MPKPKHQPKVKLHAKAEDPKPLYADGVKVEVRDGIAFLSFFHTLPPQLDDEVQENILLCRIAVKEDVIGDFCREIFRGLFEAPGE